LPAARLTRLQKEYALDPVQAELLVAEPALAEFFENAVSELRVDVPDTSVATLYNYLTSDLRGLMNETGVSFGDIKIDPEHLAHLAALVDGGKITSRQAKDMLVKMFETGLDPEEIMKSDNIGISETGEIEAVVLAVIAENYAAVADYKKGKTVSLQFLIGKAMSILKGRARPDMLKEIFEKNLS